MSAHGPDRTLAHTLLHDMHSTTPGGINRRVFTPGRPPWLVLAAYALLGVMFFAGALVWITR